MLQVDPLRDGDAPPADHIGRDRDEVDRHERCGYRLDVADRGGEFPRRLVEEEHSRKRPSTRLAANAASEASVSPPAASWGTSAMDCAAKPTEMSVASSATNRPGG